MPYYENCDACKKCYPCPVTSGDRNQGAYPISQGAGDIWYCTNCFYCEDVCPDYSPRQFAVDQRREDQKLSTRTLDPIKQLRKQGLLFDVTKSLNEFRIDSGLPSLLQPNVMEIDLLFQIVMDELSSVSKNIEQTETNEILNQKTKGNIALFLGCLIPYRVQDYELSARNLLKKLEIDYADLPFSCCGSIMTESYSEELWLTIGAYNLALAEQEGVDTIITLCGGCVGNLRRVNDFLLSDTEKLSVANRNLSKIGKHYSGEITIQHISEFLLNRDISNKFSSLIDKTKISELQQISASVQIPCQVIRPKKHSPNSELESKLLTDLMELTQINIIHYPYELLCCGSSMLAYDEKLSYEIAKKRIDSLEKRNVDALILGCGNCSMNFKVHLAEYSTSKISMLFFTEILDYALGSENERINALVKKEK